ncbi:non-ribosomal peptide synthetase module [Paenibacillus thermotolerans]|uniref:non-ribosomal peptide synthetase module n=1 Tax=Paenibacillus thermotolerans TaxID=3027807 RepID=UPI002368CF15|nr:MULTISPECIES: non-ribosomal peptide synthetase module [unclassified Paenibacillus]
MAQRLATEYVKTCLVLTEAELMQFIQMFQMHDLAFKVKVLDNGDQEIAVEDAAGSELVLTFARKSGRYILEGPCRFTSATLANIMRKAVSEFKGDAVVNRIYEAYTIEYQYRSGSVIRITERSGRGERIIYAYQDTIGQLRELFERSDVEHQIVAIKLGIDEWLDRRNRCKDASELERIDAELKRLTRRMFALEA